MVNHSFAINLCFAICFEIGIKRFLNGTVNLLWTETNFPMALQSGRLSKWSVFKEGGLQNERTWKWKACRNYRHSISKFNYLNKFDVSNWSNHFCQRPSTLDRLIQKVPCLTGIFERAVPISISSMCKTNRFVWLGSGDGFELEFFTCLFFQFAQNCHRWQSAKWRLSLPSTIFFIQTGNTVGLTDDWPTESLEWKSNSSSDFGYVRQWGSSIKIVNEDRQ